MPKTVATPAIRFFARGLLQSACVALAIAVAIAGCSRKPEPIWIGAVGMLHDADASEDNLRGMRIAIDEANQTGGIRGRRVELRILRDSGLGELAARVAQEFVADERILAVMGHEFSSAMIAAAPVYNGKLAAVSTATSPQLSGISPWVFRVLASDSALAVVEARAFIAKGWRRVAMLYVNDSYGRGLTNAFIPAFEARGGQVVSQNPITDATTDFDIYLRQYEVSRPDVVFVICGPTSTLPFLHAAAARHLRAQIVGGDGWTATLASDPAADGLEWPSVFSPADTQIAARKFRHTFTTRYGHEPDAVSALGHDAALTVLEAIRRGGTTRTGVRDALAAPGLIVEGVTGPISFQRGDRIGRGGGLIRVRNGALTLDLRWADLLAP